MNNYSFTVIGSQKRKLGLLLVLASMFLVSAAAAQTTSTYEKRGASSTSTEIRRGEVVYISGRDLIVKMEDGQTKHFTVPQGAHFTVDGRQYGVDKLKPGMRLTQVITTTTTPKTIITVRQVSGTVWFVNAPKSVVLTLEDGTNKQFTVPDKTRFEVDGVYKTVFDLKKGMHVQVTAVTQVPETEISRQSNVTGQPAPEQAAQATAQLQSSDQIGTVLVDNSAESGAAATSAAGTRGAAAEPAPKRLPKTDTSEALLALSGLILLFTALGLRLSRELLSDRSAVA